jgi:hypothetical protein
VPKSLHLLGTLLPPPPARVVPYFPPSAVENIHYMRRCLDQLQAATRGLQETVDPLSVRGKRTQDLSASSGSFPDVVTARDGCEDASYGAAGWVSPSDRASDSTGMTQAVWGRVSGFLSGIAGMAGGVTGAAAPSPAPAPAPPPTALQHAAPAVGGAASPGRPASSASPPASADASPASAPLPPRVVTLDFDVHGDDSEWVSSLSTGGLDWLRQGSLVLAAVVRVVTCVDREGVSVLVHCSDGWDRTAQVGWVQSVAGLYLQTIPHSHPGILLSLLFLHLSSQF